MTDAISRQSVIDMLDETKRIARRNIDGAVLMTFERVLDSLVNITNALPTIQPDNNSEMPNSSDVISRQQAIDALRGYLVEKRCPDDGTLTCRLIENEVINKLPTSPNLAEVGTDCISRADAIAVAKSFWYKPDIAGELEKLPPIQPVIVRCKNCRFWNNHTGESIGCCDILKHCTREYFFCSCAERREVNHESN